MEQSRTLRGCVDWNTLLDEHGCPMIVAPYVGAWIETFDVPCHGIIMASHPTWVRGLKRLSTLTLRCTICRTLRGCVDWNVRGDANLRVYSCRTLRGCVDWNFAGVWGQ